MNDERTGTHDWFITDATHVLGFALWAYENGRWWRHPGPVTLLTEKLFPLEPSVTRGRRVVFPWDESTDMPDGSWIDSRVRHVVRLETDGSPWPPAKFESGTRVVIIPAGEHPDEVDGDDS